MPWTDWGSLRFQSRTLRLPLHASPSNACHERLSRDSFHCIDTTASSASNSKSFWIPLQTRIHRTLRQTVWESDCERRNLHRARRARMFDLKTETNTWYRCILWLWRFRSRLAAKEWVSGRRRTIPWTRSNSMQSQTLLFQMLCSMMAHSSSRNRWLESSWSMSWKVRELRTFLMSMFDPSTLSEAPWLTFDADSEARHSCKCREHVSTRNHAAVWIFGKGSMLIRSPSSQTSRSVADSHNHGDPDLNYMSRKNEQPWSIYQK